MFRSERISELLKNNFHVVRKEELSEEELDFLSNFFNIREEEDIDTETYRIKEYFVLEKKEKYLYH